MLLIKKFSMMVLGLLFSLAVFAQEPVPTQLIRNISNQVIAELQRNKAHLKNQTVIRKIITKNAIPSFDLPTIASTVTGKNHWDRANSTEHQAFINAFTRYVIDMYSSALAAYSDETVTVKPIRNYSPAMTRVQVYTIVERSRAQPVNLSYRLFKVGSTWKIYDFSVDGISMVQSYRAQFIDTLQKGGLNALTQKLQRR